MGVFYFDYIDSNMEPGYWDDQDDPPDHLDGDFLKPENNFGFAALGADYYQDIPILKSDKTNGAFALHFWWEAASDSACGQATSNTGRQQTPVTRATSSISTESPRLAQRTSPIHPPPRRKRGAAFAFGDRASIRLEGGLHSMIYWGASAGVMF